MIKLGRSDFDVKINRNSIIDDSLRISRSHYLLIAILQPLHVQTIIGMTRRSAIVLTKGHPLKRIDGFVFPKPAAGPSLHDQGVQKRRPCRPD